MTTYPINRRTHERFAVTPSYTGASVRVHPIEHEFVRDGHVYDLSEGGIRFELDEPLEVGTTISMRVDLPIRYLDQGLISSIFVTGHIVWCESSEPGPARMAMRITGFDRRGDKQRMIQELVSRRYLRAA